MIEHFYNTIFGWFNFQNHYTKMVEIADNGAHFVEIGAWKGKSSAFLATEIANSGKQIKFDCVDTWLGSAEHLQVGGHYYDSDAATGKLYDVFIANMKPVEGYYNPIKMESVEASKLYADESLDFVFIDAGHEYENVYADIKSWLPKVKPGGWIGGHDYPWNEGIRRACRELVPGHVADPCWNIEKDVYLPQLLHLGESWMYQKQS
jgi:hypothetical protein